MAFERVYTVWDYWDGPRSGVAEFHGQPHHFRCEWDETEDDYAASFVLVPIDQETLSLAMEQWSIWRAWESAFKRGDVPQESHPALGHPEYGRLETTIRDRLSAEPLHARRAVPTFRVRQGQTTGLHGVIRELEVEWTDL